MTIEERIKNLKQFLTRCDEKYFLYNESPIKDEDYDLLKQELANLEKSLNIHNIQPLFKDLKENTTKYAHEQPMLSLQKVYELDDIKDFFNKSENNSMEKSLVMELKIDGISVSLIYIDGLLTQGLTRGDGKMGEDITHNIFNIKAIPLMIKDPQLKDRKIIIRGELYLSKSNFHNHFSKSSHLTNKINGIPLDHKQLYNANGVMDINMSLDDQHHTPKGKSNNFTDESLANNGGLARNICAGIMRKKYIDEDSQYIDFFAYNILNYSFVTQWEVLSQLRQWNFPVENHSLLITHEKNLYEQVDFWSKKIKDLNYECDGIVLKINDINLMITMGNTINHPRGAIAFKFANKKKTTYLTNIQWQVGKNGRITPVGIINPIIIDGVSIKKVTLHNYDFVQNLNSKTIIVERAGGVIPKAILIPGITIDNDVKNLLNIPKNCPSCNNPLVLTDKDLICDFIHCTKQKLAKLLHFCDQLKIYGIGEKIMAKLMDHKIINSYVDILQAPKYSNGFNNICDDLDCSMVIWSKFIKQIEKIPKNFQVIKGITIDYGGPKNLAKIINLLEKNHQWIVYNYDDMMKFLLLNGFTEGIGKVMAQSIIKNRKDIKDLIDFIIMF